MSILSFLLVGGIHPVQARTQPNEQNVWFNERGECEFKEIANHISRIAVSPAGLSEAKSIEKAQEMARQKLQDQFCTGISAEDCSTVSRNISIVEYAMHPTKKQICALARMPNQFAVDPTGHISAEKELEQSLVRIISRAQKIAPQHNLYFSSAIRSDSQCLAGLTGDRLITRMKEFTVQKNIVAIETVKQTDNTMIVETKLIPQKEDWLVEVSGQTSSIPKQILGSFSLPKHFIDPSSMQEACIPSKDDRLKKGYQAHRSGLSLTVSLGEEKTSWCEGDKGHLTISASQPAQLRVFSIINTPKQQSIMIFPYQDHKGTAFDPYAADTHFDLGTTEFFPISSTPKQETILVLAVPENGDFGMLDEVKNPCFTEKPIEQWLPSDVALQIVNYTIYPAGSQAGSLQCDWENLSVEARQQNTDRWIQFLSGLDECSLE